jgi:hypothetical protein
MVSKKKRQSYPCGGPYVYGTSGLPHILDNRLIDGADVVSLKRRPLFTLQEDSWYSFPLEAESTTELEGLGQL